MNTRVVSFDLQMWFPVSTLEMAIRLCFVYVVKGVEGQT